MANVGTAYLHIMPETKGIKSELTKALDGGGTSAGKSAGLSLVGALKGVIAGAGIATFFKKALNAGGALEQSFGGLDTIYGDAAAGMKEMAFEAAQAGIDANKYAEQAVSFGAALKQAYGGDTVKAAKAADTAIMDMADNAAKMGTDMSSIQNAYQGFAKQNYTMLDNLKLGYGGTQSEMKRLLSDAQKLTGVEYDISNLGDVYDAIHAIQTDLGITGVAAKEGAETFKGSFNAMKASATNLLASLSLGKDIKAPLRSLLTNTKNFFVGNFLPMVGNTLKGLGSAVGDALTTGLRNIPNLAESAKNVLNKFAESIQSGGGGEFIQKIGSAAKTIGGYFKNAIVNTDWKGLGASMLNLLATGVKTYGPMLWDGMKTVAGKAADWFRSVNWGDVGRTAIQLIGNGIGTVGNWLGTNIKNLATSAANFFENVNWGEAGSKAVELIGNGFQALGGFLADIGQTAKEKFKEIDWSSVGGSIVRFIGSGAKAIGSFLWGALKNIGTSAAAKIKEIDWQGVGGSIIRFITGGLKSIGSFLWNGLKGIGSTAVSTFKEIDWAGAGSSIINFIVNGITSIGTSIGTWLKHWGSEAVGKFLEVDWVQLGCDLIENIVQGIKDFGGLIGDALEWAIDQAKKIILGDKSEQTGVGGHFVENVAEGMEGKTGTVRKGAQSVVSTAKAVLEDGVAQAGIVGGNTGDSYAQGVGSEPNKHSATTKAGELRAAVDEGIGDSSDAYTWGADFVQNMINGIQSKIVELSKKVMEVAAVLAVKLAFSVPKEGPLHHQDEWGGHFMDNLVNGINGGIPRLRQTIDKVANTAVINPGAMPYAPAFATPYGGGTASGSNVVMNISVSGADNPDIWARQFMRASKQYSRIS